MNVPIKRGTARRLGLRTPDWSDESRYRFYRQRWATGIDADALLRSSFNVAAVDPAAVRAAASGFAVSYGEAASNLIYNGWCTPPAEEPQS